jgi:hypothetical protein
VYKRQVFTLALSSRVDLLSPLNKQLQLLNKQKPLSKQLVFRAN